MMKGILIFLLTIVLAIVPTSQYGCEAVYFDTKFLCILYCTDLGWGDGVHPGLVAANLAPKMTELCGYSEFYTLQFSNCSFPNQRIEGDWFTHEKTPKFSAFYIYESDLSSIEDNTIGKYEAFNKSLISVIFSSTPNLVNITHGMLNDIFDPNISALYLNNDGILESVEVEVIAEMSSNLAELGVDVNGIQKVEILANMTGKCQPTILDKIETVIYRYLTPGIDVFGRDLISAINSSQLFRVAFDEANIKHFEDNQAFEPFARQPNKLEYVGFEGNHLTTVPDGFFDPLISLGQEITIAFNDNPWHCDGNLQYLQDVMKDNSDNLEFIYMDYVKCSTPASQNGKLVIDADLSGEFEPSPPAPRLNIKCS